MYNVYVRICNVVYNVYVRIMCVYTYLGHSCAHRATVEHSYPKQGPYVDRYSVNV